MAPHYPVLHSPVTLSISFSELSLGKTWKCSYFSRIVKVFQKELFLFKMSAFKRTIVFARGFLLYFQDILSHLQDGQKYLTFFF